MIYYIDSAYLFNSAKIAHLHSISRGHLASIHSDAENEFIHNLIQSNYYDPWIGLSKEDLGEYEIFLYFVFRTIVTDELTH